MTGASLCLPCPDGYVCSNSTSTSLLFGGGPTSASPCPSGMAPNNLALVCLICSEGSYSPGASSTCLPCPIGSICPQGRNSTSNLILSGATSPKQCANGKFTSSIGSSTCLECVAGSYCIMGISMPCSANFFSNSSSSSCSQCPAGTYQNLEGQSSCIDCPSGYFRIGGSKYMCSPGQFSSPKSSYCLSCKPGYECLIGNGNNLVNSMTACLAGFYNNGTSPRYLFIAYHFL